MALGAVWPGLDDIHHIHRREHMAPAADARQPEAIQDRTRAQRVKVARLWAEERDRGRRWRIGSAWPGRKCRRHRPGHRAGFF